MAKSRARTVVLVRYKKTMDRVRANVKYIGFRAREQEEEERGFFNAKLDHGADYRTFLSQIEHHPALQHPSAVKAHTMILSLRETDYRALLEAGGSFKDMARELIRDLEERKGIQLTWIGAVHEKSRHPHIHLSIMSVGTDAQGHNRRLYLNKEDCEWLRQALDKKLERYVPERKTEMEKSRIGSHSVRLRRAQRMAGHHIKRLAEHTQPLQHNTKFAEQTNARRRRRRAKTRIQIQQSQPNLDR
ncbi:hypothetical protein [Alicyclobacillus macrosporangiidus]|uniref:Relaxase/Mobilisation nuclease domain-containing protein n=1 Tax=Alicyclobacillus macrosporangiidus TaxID=392015 RepID=A0A1I7L1P9_9BACL|nr:hypothetical protein [Alicyclobacillus macrosporangiidus]SFV03631.1 hypothetical protein SAMN05421543_12311 [Alicyclobacillus macrosporangiidus]